MSTQTFPSAVRSATLVGGDNTKVPGAKGATFCLTVTAVPGVDTVQMVIEGKDRASGTYETLLTFAARVATGQDVATIYPGITETAGVDVSDPLPDVYRIRIVHSAGTPFTYSVSVDELS